MFRNYLKITVRSILRQKGYSVINITGLAIGIAGCLFILSYVMDELKYDHHHENGPDIYRVILDGRIGTQEMVIPTSPVPMGKTVVEELPEAIQFVRIQNPNQFLIQYGENRFNEDRFLFADSSIFQIFTIPMMMGDPATALTKPHSIVITEDTAARYFGTENPLGKSLIMEDGTEYLVTGVVENAPRQSHIEYDFLASMTSMGDYVNNDMWVSNNFLTYFLLQPGVDLEDINTKFADIVTKYAAPQIEQFTNESYENFISAGNHYRYFLEPMLDVYLHSEFENDLGGKGNFIYVVFFAIIAAFILVIACINFMNLATARSARRSREVGIRKVLGSDRKRLILQFLAESVFLTLAALLVAVGLVLTIQPLFNDLVGKALSFSLLSAPVVIPALLVFGIVVGILAGLYPALYLSSYQPARVLKGDAVQSMRTGRTRSALVIFQFSISIALICASFIVKDQLDFFMQKDLGFNKDQLLIIPRADVLEDRGAAFRQQLLRNPQIQKASFSNTIPGKGSSFNAHLREGASGSETMAPGIFWVDVDFLNTWDIQLAAGRNFSIDQPTDTMAAIINEQAWRSFGYDDPVGKRIIRINGTPDEWEYLNIVGVVQDLHFQSLHRQIDPMVLRMARGSAAYLSLKISTENVTETVNYVQNLWREFVPDKIFEYFFFDEDYAQMYQAEAQTAEVFAAFTVLALFIACLGLFGLSSFNTEQRTKEIGVRKVLGSSVTGIVRMLMKDMMILIGIAAVAGWSISWILTRKWLENFAYRTEPDLFVFLVSAFIAVGIAALTIGYQAIRAALMNPVKALHYE